MFGARSATKDKPSTLARTMNNAAARNAFHLNTPRARSCGEEVARCPASFRWSAIGGDYSSSLLAPRVHTHVVDLVVHGERHVRGITAGLAADGQVQERVGRIHERGLPVRVAQGRE